MLQNGGSVFIDSRISVHSGYLPEKYNPQDAMLQYIGKFTVGDFCTVMKSSSSYTIMQIGCTHGWVDNICHTGFT